MSSSARSTLAWAGSAAVVALMAWILFRPDVAPPDERRLRPVTTPVPDAANAFVVFQSLTNSLYWPRDEKAFDDVVAGKTWDEALVRDVLASNTVALATLRRGIVLDAWQPPALRAYSDLMPYVGTLRTGGRLLRLQARLAEEVGDIGAATRTCAELIQLGNMVQRDANSLIAYLVGAAVLQMGLEDARRLALAEGAGAANLQGLLAAVNDLDDLHGGFVRAMQAEYVLASGLVDDLASRKLGLRDLWAMGGDITTNRAGGIPLPRHLFQPNATKAMFAMQIEQLLEDARKPLREARLTPGAPDDLGSARGRWALVLKPNGIGRVLNDFLMPALSRVLEQRARLECSVSATRLLVALRLHESMHGSLPPTLDTLVPACLPAIPRDPYTGSPFHYEAAARRVYAVGPDFVDDGGSTNAVGPAATNKQPPWNGADIVFTLSARATETH